MIVEKVYDFTNENLVDLSQIYHFTDANILTVLGSGDQYFSALLAGAKNVEVFDINHLTLYHFILKFTAIKVLSYEEFIQMFVVDNLDNLCIYAKLRDFLPSKVSDFFDTLIHLQRKFSSIKIHNTIFANAKFKAISYLAESEYYRLQSILNRTSLPKFYNCNLLELPDFTTKKYDIALLSNIYHYLTINPKEYKKFLDNLNCSDILALYTWVLSEEEQAEFLKNGFDIYQIPGVLKSNDYVVNLSRKKQ